MRVSERRKDQEREGKEEGARDRNWVGGGGGGVGGVAKGTQFTIFVVVCVINRKSVVSLQSVPSVSVDTSRKAHSSAC